MHIPFIQLDYVCCSDMNMEIATSDNVEKSFVSLSAVLNFWACSASITFAIERTSLLHRKRYPLSIYIKGPGFCHCQLFSIGIGDEDSTYGRLSIDQFPIGHIFDDIYHVHDLT